MSLLSPDELRVSIAPDQVLVERRRLELTLRGMRTRLVERQVLRVFAPVGRNRHAAALQAMGSALATVGDRAHCRVRVVLANSLVRYLLVPQSNRLSPEDEAAVVRHCFNEVHGDAAEQWELRASPALGHSQRLASGVDRELIEDLRNLAATIGITLDSIQPRLMTVCNEHRKELKQTPAWLLLVEPGNLCLGLLERDGLTRLRSLRIDGRWASDLPEMLEREACLAELDEMPGDAYLWLRTGISPGQPLQLAQRLHALQDPWPDEAAGAAHLAVVRS